MPRERWVRTVSIGAVAVVFMVCVPCGAHAAAQLSEAAGKQTVAEPELSDQERAALSGRLSAQERMDLLARLSDSQIRDLLIRYLEQNAVPQASAGMGMAAGVIGDMNTVSHRIRSNLRNALMQTDRLPSVPSFAVARLSEGRPPDHLFWVAVGMALMFAAAAGAEWLFRRLSVAVRRNLESGQTHGLGGKLGKLSLRLVLDFFAIGVFALAAIGTFFLMYQGHEPTRAAVMTYVGAVLLVRLATLASRFLLAPTASALRLVPLDDSTARYLHACVLWFAVVASFGFLTSGLLQLLGLDAALHDLLQLSLAVVVTVMLVAMIWQGRRGVADAIRGNATQGSATRVQRVIADVWHILAIAYVIAVAGLATVAALAGYRVGVGAAIGSLLIVIAVPLADAAMRHVLANVTASPSAGGFQTVVRRALRILLALVAFVVIARLWGVDVFSLAEQGIGARLARATVDIGLTLLVAYVGWEIARTAIDRQLAANAGTAEADRGSEGGGKGVSRLQTLLPLFRRFLQFTIAAMVVMIVLSSLGVNIGPLIAGAGVVGLAVGFGAQTLVRDVVSGVFFLIDDAFRMGEYVDLGSVKGTVEAINVRSLVLRHHRGPLHTIPFGEIKHLTNYSRDWAIMKLEFRVPYETDINKVKRIFKQIGKELLEDEELGPSFIEPLKSQGVTAMDDSAMIIRAKFMAKPGEQFTIRKEVYRRAQRAFQDNGIQFARRRVIVDLPPGMDEEGPSGRAVADAAAAAVTAADTADAKKPA